MKNIYHISSEFRILVRWVHLTVSAGRLPNHIPGEAHLKMNKTRHTICNQWSTVINTNRFFMSARNWSSTIHTKITEKMRSEPAIVCENMWPAGECDSPKKTSYLAGCVFLQKKRLAPLLRDFRIDIFSQPTKNGQVQCWLLLKGEFWWSSWKVIGVIMMWILGFSSEFDYLSPSSKFLIDFMFKIKSHRGVHSRETQRQSAWFLSCSIVEEVGVQQ